MNEKIYVNREEFKITVKLTEFQQSNLERGLLCRVSWRRMAFASLYRVFKFILSSNIVYNINGNFVDLTMVELLGRRKGLN